MSEFERFHHRFRTGLLLAGVIALAVLTGERVGRELGTPEVVHLYDLSLPCGTGQ